MDRKELLRLAQVGAQAKLMTLQAEIQTILKQFPNLRGGEGARTNRVGPTRLRRRRMSAEARAKISAAQKRRWAKQKAGKAK